MKSTVRRRFVSVALVVAAILALVVPVAAWAEEILPGPDTVAARLHRGAGEGAPIGKQRSPAEPPPGAQPVQLGSPRSLE